MRHEHIVNDLWLVVAFEGAHEQSGELLFAQNPFFIHNQAVHCLSQVVQYSVVHIQLVHLLDSILLMKLTVTFWSCRYWAHHCLIASSGTSPLSCSSITKVCHTSKCNWLPSPHSILHLALSMPNHLWSSQFHQLSFSCWRTSLWYGSTCSRH